MASAFLLLPFAFSGLPSAFSLLPFAFQLPFTFQEKPSAPIIVKLIEPPHDPTGGLGAVLVGAIGLSGALALGALVVGIVVGLVMFLARSRHPLS